MTEVAPSLKARFAEWIDARTAKGITTYGVPLATNNGRDSECDTFEELLDFCQYQEQSRLELKADSANLRRWYSEAIDQNKELTAKVEYLQKALETLNGPHWEMMP